MFDERIAFRADGGSVPGFLAHPDKVPAPGVVVIQEWWGLNAHIQDVTRRMAGAGYYALAPDLYHGRVATEPDEARKLRMELDQARALREIDGAVAYLLALDNVQPKKAGIVGFCMGGGLTLWAAARNPDIGAAVAFYGGGAPRVDEFGSAKAAILNIVGEKDEGVLSAIRALDTGLRGRGILHELVVYPGCGHAFFNDTRPEVYEVGAAHDAWMRTVNWLRAHLV